MFFFGDYIEPARDPEAAPWRWRWPEGAAARVRFGLRAALGAAPCIRWSFAPGNGVWEEEAPERVAGAPPGHHLYQALIQPPPGEASCVYEIGWRRDGDVRWSGRRRPLLFSSPTGPRPITPGPTDWRARTHYALMIDRFAVGEPSRQGLGLVPHDPASPFAAHGGDLAGAAARLDYLAEFGVGAVMLSPVYLNGPEGYHGYHPLDLYGVDPRIGDMAALRGFVDAAHAKGIAVILDMVVNHIAPSIDWARDGDGWRGVFRYDRGAADALPLSPAALHDPALFHHPGFDGDDVRGRLFGFLDDWRTEDEAVRKALIDHLKFWLAETDADGFRYDAVRHVDSEFWAEATREVAAFAAEIGKTHFRQIGEHSAHLSGEAGEAAKAGGFEGMVDYPLHYALRASLAGEEGGMAAVARAFDQDCFDWPDSRLNLACLENHDTDRALAHWRDRFGDLETARAAVRAHMALLFFGPEIPLINQGQEQEFEGALRPWVTAEGRELISDAHVREDLFPNPDCVWRFGLINQPKWPAYDQTNPTWLSLQEMARLRRALPGLVGDRAPLRDASDGFHLYHMGAGADRLLVAINLTASPQPIEAPAAAPLFQSGEIGEALGPYAVGLWRV